MIHIKSSPELTRMRQAGRHVGEILLALREQVEPGMTTGDLDRAAAAAIRERALQSSFLGYAPGGAPPYPAVVCTSVNEEIVHGIPGERELHSGDVLKIDFGVICEGFHGDSAVTVVVGGDAASDELTLRMIEVTRASLYAGVEQLRVGNRLGDVSHAVQCAVEKAGFTVVRDFVGHGIGRKLHEKPQIPNFGPAGRGPRLRAGMVVAIEPMVNLGTHEVVMREDRWTAATADGQLSCHFEHTIAITENGPEILTQIPGSH